MSYLKQEQNSLQTATQQILLICQDLDRSDQPELQDLSSALMQCIGFAQLGYAPECRKFMAEKMAEYVLQQRTLLPH
jgi:hypothetical protein